MCQVWAIFRFPHTRGRARAKSLSNLFFLVFCSFISRFYATFVHIFKNYTADGKNHSSKYGDYGLVEIKLGGETLVAQGVETLDRLAALARAKLKRQPSFRMVLTAVGPFAYRRKDGIVVAPIGSLRP